MVLVIGGTTDEEIKRDRVPVLHKTTMCKDFVVRRRRLSTEPTTQLRLFHSLVFLNHSFIKRNEREDLPPFLVPPPPLSTLRLH